MDRTIIKPFEEQDLKIYAYTLPEVSNHDGCIKVGETSRTVEERIAEQTRTVGLTANILFKRQAKKCNGEWFHDKDLHRYFILNKIPKKDFGTGADEWFYFNGTPEKAEELTDSYIAMDYDVAELDDGKYDYVLRAEQAKAVEETLKYYKDPIHGPEFLWNAKPRFGKTLTTYDFIRKLNATNILIVTNRPAIANSWYDDFQKFIAWQEPRLKFVSDTEALKGKVMTRSNFIDHLGTTKEENPGCVAFVSLQDLKGAKVFGGDFDKLQWVAGLEWDLLIIDEAHEGVDTSKTDKAFNKIKRKFTLHLSGTPFKAIANNKFHKDQIYNWSYVDEQLAKENWDKSIGTNPYENLPTLSLFTYQMSKMIEDKVEEGLELSNESNVDYAFDLNEFFRTKENGIFVYENSVRKFLDNLTEGKFPFAKSEYRYKLNHTFWLLPRVAAAKAMEKLLKNHPVFCEYEIVLAAGDGISLDEDVDGTLEKLYEDVKQNEKSFDKVKRAIKTHDKTITLSVGQLTTGVTIPEWTAVFMLSNIKSPSLYFQAAFRSQNPYEFIDEETGELLRKENAYIFDFAPERTLILFDEFANNLSMSASKGTTDERKENIKELLNFFPVIAEDSEGRMHELDAGEVLTIPNQIKSYEVVKRGFMSNFLFVNISAIFSAPAVLKEILDKISPEKNKRLTTNKEITVTDPMLNDEGEVEVADEIVINQTKDLFGDRIYKDTEDTRSLIRESGYSETETIKITKSILDNLEPGFNSFKESFDLNKTQLNKTKTEVKKDLEKKVEEKLQQHAEEVKAIEETFKEKISTLKSDEEIAAKREELKLETEKINKMIEEEISETVKEVVEETVEKEIVRKEEAKKKATEDEVRDHLRGFTRTIPAFLMAYGDEETTLANFDKKVDEATFEELTSITLDEFRQLRDGVIVTDEDGNEREVGGLFDEIVFNASIKEFLELKKKLSNYLTTTDNEDIFDYIPPQKTNQIFTPRVSVKLMVDMLERENPYVFKNKETTFIDLYSKSGFYITEIIKRLNKGIKNEIPNEEKRIKWIMENQVYACTPSNIIYNMVKNYVFGGFNYVDTKNLVELDLSLYAEKGQVEEKLKEKWGDDMKFDVVIGNPPYQESDGGAQASAKPIYQYFMQGAKKMNPDYICLITPSRWYVGGKGLDDYRDEMLNDIHLQELHDWLTPNDIFPNTNIRGGVSYYLWNAKYDNTQEGVRVVSYKDSKIISDKKRPLKLSGVDILVRDNIGVGIIQKISSNKFLSEFVSPRKPFGLATNFTESIDFHNTDENLKEPIKCYYKGQNVGFVERKLIDTREEWIDKWKIFMPYANNIGTELSDDNLNTFIGEPDSICTETYLVLGADLNLDKNSCYNITQYTRTKFLRFLHSLAKGSQHATAKTYIFVPLQDFTDKSDIDWSKDIKDIDEQLFDKYKLTDEERNHISSSIKEMK
ncbi:Eco57I restriction-modification methylase domain-containing protein [Clostridium cochlearium]|uniref:Eco57I restriction-modification methylase domain-containing protein n=1 Tax=Clostridium cochlearium TaxID=1494 RepID=UPI001C0EFEE3|nr:Eco57I restriction-modification methylase domain-containing protein [Clostridium cochlearium]MBU5269468.1 Eco57I restriction-modification methylase domain-containing protein [Clostridium cochlearium]